MRTPLLALVALAVPAGNWTGARAETPAGPADTFVVALDAGHGGSNLGAVAGDGLLEKDVTLALARRVRARLEAIPGMRVVMCRDADVLIPIRARSRCAARAGAHLFLSLHANATPAGVAPGSQRGFELYVLPPEDVDDDATLAALEAPGAPGVWAAHRVHAAARGAVVAAGALEARLRRAPGALPSRGVRQTGAALDVLRATGTAAVLVEVGFLDDLRDRRVLATPDGQEMLAEALVAGVSDYRAAAPR